MRHVGSWWPCGTSFLVSPPREGGGARLPGALVALAPLEAPSQSRGVPPAPRHVPRAAPSAAKAAYNTAGEGIWEQTGLGEKAAFFPLTGLLGFQPNLSTAAGEGWRVPCPPPGQGEPAGTARTRRFSISVHAGTGAATGASWCGPASDRHSTGTCWEALVGTDGCSPSCHRDVALSPHGDSRGGHRAPLLPHRHRSREPGTTGTRPATLTPCRWQLGESKPQFTATLGRRA